LKITHVGHLAISETPPVPTGSHSYRITTTICVVQTLQQKQSSPLVLFSSFSWHMTNLLNLHIN